METYIGKNAIWLIIIFALFNLVPIIICFFNPDSILISNPWAILFWLVYYACNLIWIPVMGRNRIELYDDYFIFYYGFSKEKIMLSDIIRIEKSNNPIAASANSLDRIYIVTKDQDFYVSLKDNDAFIKALNYKKTK
ncbi:MAG: acyltransferase [Erysipelotrichia bacterium]|nr:acyltransferase [Erysipelotrichia bacterium]NCC54534.1 acyltransferase [Erysipelotrichia bacterium]